MTTAAKITRLMRPYRINAIAQASRVSAPTLRKLMRVEGASTSLDIVRRIAAALGVDHGWLLDDAQTWPPVRIERPATDMIPLTASRTRGAA